MYSTLSENHPLKDDPVYLFNDGEDESFPLTGHLLPKWNSLGPGIPESPVSFGEYVVSRSLSSTGHQPP